MKKKIVPFALGLMAISFVYLRMRQIVVRPVAPETERPPLNLPLIKEEQELVELQIGSARVRVEIADTIAKQQQGLSDRAGLPKDQGMYFPMGGPSRHTFWMQRMNFPLDVLWIRDGRIVDISENVPQPKPGEQPVTMSPKDPADAVLEVNTDFTEKHGVKIGDTIDML